MNGVYFGHYYNSILFLRKGHFKSNLKICNWWNLMCLEVEGNEWLGLIISLLAPSFLINAPCLLGSREPKMKQLCCSHCLSGASGCRGVCVGSKHWCTWFWVIQAGALAPYESWRPHLDSQPRPCRDPGHVGSADSLQMPSAWGVAPQVSLRGSRMEDHRLRNVLQG